MLGPAVGAEQHSREKQQESFKLTTTVRFTSFLYSHGEGIDMGGIVFAEFAKFSIFSNAEPIVFGQVLQRGGSLDAYIHRC